MKQDIFKQAERGIAHIMKWGSIACLVGLLLFVGAAVLWRARTHFHVEVLPKTLWYMILPISGAIVIGYTIWDLWKFLRGDSLH
ncbi:MAG: hypothetical protein ACUVWO_12095 [Thermodesulfobacteriota bacterium]